MTIDRDNDAPHGTTPQALAVREFVEEHNRMCPRLVSVNGMPGLCTGVSWAPLRVATIEGAQAYVCLAMQYLSGVDDDMYESDVYLPLAVARQVFAPAPAPMTREKVQATVEWFASAGFVTPTWAEVQLEAMLRPALLQAVLTAVAAFAHQYGTPLTSIRTVFDDQFRNAAGERTSENGWDLWDVLRTSPEGVPSVWDALAAQEEEDD